jgi:creatinine amidohydrolase
MGESKESVGSDGKRQSGCLWFDELSTVEAKQAANDGTVIIIPVGSVEEHGEHLPLCTDSVQPEYVALEVARKTGCLVAPTLRYGVCNQTRNFAGTISISFDSLRAIVLDILEEFVRNGFRKLLILSGHAGSAHMMALRLAAEEVLTKNNVNSDPIRIMVLSDYDFAYELKGNQFPLEDGHAGTIETSRMIAIRPDLRKSIGKASFPSMPRFEVLAHAERYFPSGVRGDPTIATESKGRMLNSYIIEKVTELVKDLNGRPNANPS